MSTTKTILDVTWGDILKDLKAGKIELYEISDGITVNIEKNRSVTISRDSSVGSLPAHILERINEICKTIDESKTPASLVVTGPGCSSISNIKKHVMIIDPAKKKLIHDFDNKIEGVKVAQAPLASNAIERNLRAEFKKIRSLKIRQTVTQYISCSIDKMKLFEIDEKDTFMKILRHKVCGDDLELDVSIRNDMQKRRQIQRLTRDFWLTLENIMKPVIVAVRKVLLRRSSQEPQEWFYDKVSEISSRNAKLNALAGRALRENRESAMQVMSMYGVSDQEKNLVSTLGLKVLLIYKEKNYKVILPLIVGLENRLKQLLGER